MNVYFVLKKCFFGAPDTIKNSDKSKYVYSGVYIGYWIAFDEAASWNFGNDFTRNVVIFGVNDASSSHTNNSKNNF